MPKSIKSVAEEFADVAPEVLNKRFGQARSIYPEFFKPVDTESKVAMVGYDTVLGYFINTPLYFVTNHHSCIATTLGTFLHA